MLFYKSILIFGASVLLNSLSVLCKYLLKVNRIILVIISSQTRQVYFIRNRLG